MNDTELDFEEILKALREQIGSLAQEVAILKATVVALKKQKAE